MIYDGRYVRSSADIHDSRGVKVTLISVHDYSGGGGVQITLNSGCGLQYQTFLLLISIVSQTLHHNLEGVSLVCTPQAPQHSKLELLACLHSEFFDFEAWFKHNYTRVSLRLNLLVL